MKKTKKALLAVVACAATFAGAFGLAACNELGDGTTPGHTHSASWNTWTVTTKPTATEKGKATRTCENEGCDAADADKEYELPVLGSSDYTKGTDSATCAAGGKVTYTYNKDGVNVSFEVVTPKTDNHTWGPWTVEEANKPTEEAGGKATRTCTVEGCTVAADEHTLPALDSEEYTTTADTATCAAGGTVTYTYNKDGVNVSFEVTTEKTNNHVWGAWTVEEANKPTAENPGKATRTCTVTGCTVAAQEHTLPPLDETNYTKTDDTATCVAGGTVTYTYNKDGVNVSFEVTTEKTNNHVWGAWTVEEANKPTAENPGKATRTCTVTGCTQVDEHVLPALNETDYEKSADTATCVAGGTVTYTYNKDGVNVSFEVATPKTDNHTWGPWTVTKENEPTEAKDGKATRTCTVEGCTQVDEHVLPALNDTDYEKSADSATCKEGGTITYTYNQDGINKVFAVETPVNPAAHGTLVHHEAEFISCELGGNVEYWECPLCGKKFDAAEGGNELTDVTTPAGHNYVITVNKENGTATEACVNEGCTTGETKTYKYFNDDNAGTQSAPTSIMQDNYYLEKATNGVMVFKLDLTEAAVYKLDFEHLVAGSIGAINYVYFDGSSSNQVAYGARTASIKSAYINVATISHSGMQTTGFTFDATNYTGHYLLIQLAMQKQPKIKMSVSKDKAPLKVGDNTVSITEANAMFIDTYEFIPAETKGYSMTVPEGVEVLMNDNDFIVGEDRTVNFDGVADEKIVFAFKNTAAGNVTVTIGDAVEKVTLTPDTPIANLTLTGHGASVIEIGDIEAGKYTVTLTVNRLLTRGTLMYFGKNTSTDYNDYFQANGNTIANSPADASFQVPIASVLDDTTIYSASISGMNYIFTLDLKKGDKLVFVHNGNDASGNNISMAKA